MATPKPLIIAPEVEISELRAVEAYQRGRLLMQAQAISHLSAALQAALAEVEALKAGDQPADPAPDAAEEGEAA